MSFTQDELRAFNSILEQRLAAHRRDVEHMLDLRIQNLRRDVEQRLTLLQQEVLRMLAQKLLEQQSALNDALNQKFGMQQANIVHALERKFEREREQGQEQQDLTGLAAQLLAIEQLLQQQISQPMFNGAIEQVPRFEAIEVQTDLPWDDLLAIFGKALDERLATLKDSLQSMVQTAVQDAMQAAIKDGEHQVASSHVLSPQQEYVHFSPQSYSDNLTTMQEVFHSIERLEHIIESMQVAMTNNHALLANRLFHHQQLPQERAHPAQSHSQPPQLPPTPANHSNGTASHIVPAEQDGQ